MSEHAPSLSPLGRSLVVAAFAVLCAMIFGFLWVNSGGKVPLVTRTGYEVGMDVPKAGNLVYFSDVMVAGVKVGKVEEIESRGDHARVVISLDPSVAPLHEGATVQLRSKSLVEESFVEITDGDGAEIEDGATLPDSAIKQAVHLDDVLATFDPDTRRDLGKLVRSSGLATRDTRAAIEQAMIGLGELGRSGADVVDALAAQSTDLEQLTRHSTHVMSALLERREALRSLVDDTQVVSGVSAARQENVRDFVRALPPLLAAAEGSSDDLERLGVALLPVAENLRDAAPDLTAALLEMPATTRELRATMPYLDQALVRAPATLRRVPTFGEDVDALLPEAEHVMADANPMLAYMAPYGRDVAGFFSNFAQVLAMGDANGKFLRVMPVINEQSYKGFPISTNIGPLDKYNPLPGADTLNEPGPYRGEYPRVERQPLR